MICSKNIVSILWIALPSLITFTTCFDNDNWDTYIKLLAAACYYRVPVYFCCSTSRFGPHWQTITGKQGLKDGTVFLPLHSVLGIPKDSVFLGYSSMSVTLYRLFSHQFHLFFCFVSCLTSMLIDTLHFSIDEPSHFELQYDINSHFNWKGVWAAQMLTLN